jgi:hypothetical protein
VIVICGVWHAAGRRAMMTAEGRGKGKGKGLI